MYKSIIFSAAVEGFVDEAVVRKLVKYVNVDLGGIYGKDGKPYLRQRIKGYNNAARHSPWIVLVDLNQDADCAPPLRQEWLPNPAPFMCFRIAVRAVEAWLLSDRERIASFLSVARSRVPSEPENLHDPKEAMVNLARQSRRRNIREDMVPRPGAVRKIGPAYPSRLVEFVSSKWRPDVARRQSNSLDRALHCLKHLIQRQF